MSKTVKKDPGGASKGRRTIHHTGKKARTLVIDFPWKLQMGGGDNIVEGSFQHELPYDVMTDDEIRAFPIDDFAAPESLLFLWVTQSKVPLGLELLKRWGYTYHYTFTWIKETGITLYGIRRDTELVILGYRGKFKIRWDGEALHGWFKTRRDKHSQKPRVFYNMIREKTPEPRLDVFARRRHVGFEPWGDQVEEGVQDLL